jgi:hypothetical protein
MDLSSYFVFPIEVALKAAEETIVRVQKKREELWEFHVKEAMEPFTTGFWWFKKTYQRTREDAEKYLKDDSIDKEWEFPTTYQRCQRAYSNTMNIALNIKESVKHEVKSIYLSREDAQALELV